ncbi:MAG: hypothetical protein IBJ03_04010 [Gemmatimonadaceae bacterium]|nr:hypothetical protein [Gemmatimonadaceae bacterium]
MISEDDGLSRPSRIIVINGKLVVLDRGADHVVRVYDVSKGARIATFGRRGQGPGEFEGAWDLFRSASSHTMWVLDVSLRRVTELTLDSLLSSQRYRGDAHITLSGEGSLESLRLFGDRGFMGTGSYSRGRLAEYSRTGSFLRVVGMIPRDAPRWAPVVAQDAFAARLGNYDVADRVVVAYRWTDRLEVLDSQGTPLAAMDRPLGFEPIISDQSTSRAAFTLDSRRAYLSTVSTDSHVCALFSGRTEREAGKANSFGRDVLIFASNGRLRRILRLDADVLAIAIDDTARELYALAHDPAPRILRYRMPSM